MVHLLWFSYVGYRLMSDSTADGGGGTFIFQHCICWRWELSEYHPSSKTTTTSYTTNIHTTTITAFTQCQ